MFSSRSEKAFPQTPYTTKTQRQMDYVEDENGQKGKKQNSVLCGCSGGVAYQVRFAARHIPKPVIINGLTSTGKKKKPRV